MGFHRPSFRNHVHISLDRLHPLTPFWTPTWTSGFGTGSTYLRCLHLTEDETSSSRHYLMLDDGPTGTTFVGS
jgi:hypothetical protein